MANTWSNAVMTTKGLALQAKLLAGTTLIITKAQSGSGTVEPSALPSQTAVTSAKQTLTFRTTSYPSEGTAAVPVYLGNDTLTTGYTATQIGVFAQDPDEGEILFFIAQAANGEGTEIPSNEEMPGYSAEWTFYFSYGQADSVDVTVSPAHTVSAEEAQEMIDTSIEEAALDASQIETGVLDVTHGGTGQTSVDTTPTSGSENMVTSGGVYAAINTAVGSINASQITGGTLPIARGGTGNATGLAASATKLATARNITVNLASTTAASFDGTANVTPGVSGTLPIARGGTGNTTGNAATATKLETARTIRTNLASTSTASFDGSRNIAPGVTGTLPVANGGTGQTSVDTTPTSGSSKMVTSGGVYSSLHAINTSWITAGTLPVARGGTGQTSVDTSPTSGSSKMVTSGGVYTALSGKQKTITSGTAAPSGGSNGDIYIQY